MVERIGMGEHNLSLVRTNIYLVTVHKSCQMVLQIPEKKKKEITCLCNIILYI